MLPFGSLTKQYQQLFPTMIFFIMVDTSIPISKLYANSPKWHANHEHNRNRGNYDYLTIYQYLSFFQQLLCPS